MAPVATSSTGTIPSVQSNLTSMNHLSTGAKAGIGVGVAVVVITALVLLWLYILRARRSRQLETIDSVNPMLNFYDTKGRDHVSELHSFCSPLEAPAESRRVYGELNGANYT